VAGEGNAILKAPVYDLGAEPGMVSKQLQRMQNNPQKRLS